MYYPKSEILSVKYTSGAEYVVKTTRVPYTGYYYATNDGRFFSGKEYSAATVELIEDSGGFSVNQSTSPTFYYPMPNEADYNKGSFTRYVTKRVNSGLETITEVNEAEFNRTSRDPLYITAKFSWKITGPLHDDLSDPNYPIYGIIDTNKRTLDVVEKTIKGVKNYFKNLSQYAK